MYKLSNQAETGIKKLIVEKGSKEKTNNYIYLYFVYSLISFPSLEISSIYLPLCLPLIFDDIFA